MNHTSLMGSNRLETMLPEIMSPETLTIALEIDATGLACPLPLLKAKQGLRQIRPGELLRVRATDPGSVRDMQSFADLSGHALLKFDEIDRVFIYVLRRQDEPEAPAC